LNEAVACLREGVVESADLLDAGVIFGTGYAPFRGGPMHTIYSGGLEQQRRRLEALEQRHGGKFHPDAGWTHLGEV
jgi:3-hydroxyacyl-CoA dehydrogenase / enoyl-CoA hydratase / 3-hydroxybutyryl-CoA epimerase